MKASIGLAALALFIASPAIAADLAPGQFVVWAKGDDLYKYCTTGSREVCLGYIEGVADTLEGSGTGAFAGLMVCMPPGIPAARLREIFLDFIEQQPVYRDVDAAEAVALALWNKYQCSRPVTKP